jgi:hypothetical protein
VLDQRIGGDDADERAVVVDDQHGTDIRPDEVLGRLPRRGLCGQGRRVGEHAVTDETHAYG